MRKFGLLWPQGDGERSVAMQREQLREYGLGDDDIGKPDEFPDARDDIPTECIAIHLAALAEDPGGKKKQYPNFISAAFRRLVGENGSLFVHETGKTYTGVAGLDELINDWTQRYRRGYTQLARDARSRGRLPKWWRKLSPSEQRQLRSDFEASPRPKAAIDLAADAGTTRETLYRFAKQQGWKPPEKFKGET